MKQTIPLLAPLKVVATGQIFRAVDADPLQVLLAEISGKRARYSPPLCRLRSEVEAEITRGELEVLEEDPYAVEPVSMEDREDMSASERKKEEKFDEKCDFAHSVVWWMLIEAGISIGDKAVWRQVTNKAAKIFNVNVTTCRRWLSLFWRNGCTQHGMRAEYRTGKKPDTAKKRGRKARPGNEGKQLTEHDKKRIHAHYEATRGKKLTNKKRWRDYLNEYHRDGIDGFTLDDEPIIIYEKHDQCPSFASWLGVVYSDKDYAAELKAELGELKFKVKFRPKHGSYKASTYGPLSRVEIDFTIGSKYLLARNRINVLGKPVIGMGYDVFSSAVVGVIETWEHASEMTLRLLLENVMTDKVEFCARHGVTITPSQWPMHYVPIHCVFDRGSESKFTIGNEFPMEFGFGWENVATGDPIKKANVESNYAKVERLAKPRPGWEPVYYERGDADAAADAVLTLDDDMQLLIKDIIHHNNSELESRYIDPAAYAAGCRTPNEVFLWGMVHRAGIFKVERQDTLRWRIAPPEKAVLNGNVLLYRGMEYYSEEMEPILIKAKAVRRIYVTIRRNHHKVDEIYYRPDPRGDKSRVIACKLTPRFEHLKGCSFDEVAVLQEQKRQDAAARSQPNRDKDLGHDNTTQIVIDRATKLTRAARKAAGLDVKDYDDKNARKNRKDEAGERSQEDFNGAPKPESEQPSAAAKNGMHADPEPKSDEVDAGQQQPQAAPPKSAKSNHKKNLHRFRKLRK